MRLLIRVTFLVFLLNQFFSPCTALKSVRDYGGAKSNNNVGTGPKTLAGTSSGLPGQNATRRGLGISAWGIVAVIITLILAGMGMYYFATCYPIICQKQGNYNMMGMTPV